MIPMCAGEDVAWVGAAILAEPGYRVGRVHYVFWAHTRKSMAQTLPDGLERQIEHVQIYFEEFKAQPIER